jgi:hypothetical protein
VPEPIQYFMDQHVPTAVTNALARHGVNVLTASDAGRCGFSDADQLAFATAAQRVMVTFAPDFIGLH